MDSPFGQGVNLLVNTFGIPVIPIPPKQKGTILKDWPNKATTDRQQLIKWYKKNPNFNIGAVATNDGVCILDDDDGLVKERYQAATGNPFPVTFSVKTSGDRFHYYFVQTPAAIALGNKKKAGQFDFQQNGKYVVGPYSVHPSGIIYTPDDNDIVPIPDALIAWIASETNPGHHITVSEDAEVTDKQKSNFEKYLGPQGHDQEVVELGYDDKGTRYAYSITTGCPFRHLHTNPDTCAINKEFYVYISPTGPQCKCVHNSCEMSWAKYRDYLIEKSGRNFPLYEAADSGKVVVGVYDAAKALLDADLASMAKIPTFPPLCLEGSYIGELALALTEKTKTPPAFVYNHIKLALGMILDHKAGFPFQPAISLRQFVMNVSVGPQTGKKDSRCRVYDANEQGERGVLFPLLSKYGVHMEDGNEHGSGQALKKHLAEDCEGARVLMKFEEMSELYRKCKGSNNILEIVLLQLFDTTSVGSNLVSNKIQAQNVRLGLSGDFTAHGFREAFEGGGSIGSGLLSRCVFAYADKVKYFGKWPIWNVDDFKGITDDISSVIASVCAPEGEHQHLFVPEETEAAGLMYGDFLQKIGENEELQDFVDRIDIHFKIDLLLRAMFSNNGQNTITEELVAQSIAWSEYQIAVRRKLWQAEGADPISCMQIKIMNILRNHKYVKGGISDADFSRFLNFRTQGGQHHYERAMKSLQHGSGQVEIIGRNQKGFKVYALRDKENVGN